MIYVWGGAILYCYMLHVTLPHLHVPTFAAIFPTSLNIFMFYDYMYMYPFSALSYAHGGSNYT